MKKRIISMLLCMALLLGGCAGAKEKKETDAQNTQSQQNVSTSDEQQPKEDKEQRKIEAKLATVNPSAYGSTYGIKLEKGSYISIIGRAETGDFWKEIGAGVEQASQDLNAQLGYSGEDKVKVTFNAPSKEDDVSDQINILDEELARYPDVVGISIIDIEACKVQFDLALENGIPIVVYDSGSDYQNIAAMCTTDNVAAASTAADHMGELLDGKGNVLIAAHDSTSETSLLRIKAIQEELSKKYPNISATYTYHLDELESRKEAVSAYYKANEDSEDDLEPDDVQQSDVLRYILDTNPGISGICTTDATSTADVVNALDDKGEKDIKVIGFDGGSAMEKYVKKGKIDGFVLQNPFGMGYAAVVACARTVEGSGNEAVIDSGYMWVDKKSIKTEEVKNMLY